MLRPLLLYIFLLFPLAAADSISLLVRPFENASITNLDSLAEMRPKIESAVRGFDACPLNALRTNRAYVVIGTVYTYYAMLTPETNIDERIRAYERALSLRKDPDSIYNLATLYKIKYNEAKKKNDVKSEIEFGKKIYHELDLYIRIMPRTGKKTVERRDYFKLYTELD